MATLLPMTEANLQAFRAVAAAEEFEMAARAISGRSRESCRRLRARLDRLGEGARAEWRLRATIGWRHPDIRMRAMARLAARRAGVEAARLEDHLLRGQPRPDWFSHPSTGRGLLGALDDDAES